MAAGACSTSSAGRPPGALATTPSQPVAPSSAASKPPARIVFSAAPNGSPCRPVQLVARFASGGFGTGNLFGGVVVRDTSRHPCLLRGPVGFSAVEADGAVDLNATVIRDRRTRHVDALLPPTKQWARRHPNFVDFILQGEYRDDRHGPRALCTNANEVTPAMLIITVGRLRFAVTNRDLRDRSAWGVTTIYGCHGNIMLSGIDGPQVVG